MTPPTMLCEHCDVCKLLPGDGMKCHGCSKIICSGCVYKLPDLYFCPGCVAAFKAETLADAETLIFAGIHKLFSLEPCGSVGAWRIAKLSMAVRKYFEGVKK